MTLGKSKLSFVRTGEAPSVPLCEQSLRREFNELNQAGDSSIATADSAAAPKRLSLTFIGIGKKREGHQPLPCLFILLAHCAFLSYSF